MRCLSLAAVVAFSALVLTGCGGGSSGIASSGSYNPGYGPFDKDGNYIEAWADKPATKHWWAGKAKSAPEPKASAPPKPAPVIASATPKPRSSRPTATRPTEVASLSRTRTVSRPAPAVVAYTPPPRTTYTPRTSKPAAKPSSRPAPKPAPVVTYTPPAPKPAPVPVKPAKPAPIRHTVTSGDTLYSLSRKYGTTVSAIQRANGIKGTNIITGKTYLIPR